MQTRLLIVGLAVLAAVLGVGGLGPQSGPASNRASSRGRVGAQPNADGNPSTAPDVAVADGPAQDLHKVDQRKTEAVFGAREIPLSVSVSSTRGLADGDAVTLHVVPKDGSLIYGFEAWLCKGGTTYQFDADVRPTLTGKCVANPLSARSQDYLQVPAPPPYKQADATFRVGVGSTSFSMKDGTPATVTCGNANPCAVVIKLQFPNGFGFETIPVTFR